jgi:hypothetical protein
MTTELEKYDRWEEQKDVMKLFVQNKNETEIAKQLDIPRPRVKEAIAVWKESASGKQFLQERVEDLLTLTDEHYSELIRRMYEIVDEIDKSLPNVGAKEHATMLGQKNSALSKIADFESKRIEILQKAGLLEAADLGDQFAEQEEKQQELLTILREVSFECENCKMEVARRISVLMGRAEPLYAEETVEAEVVG